MADNQDTTIALATGNQGKLDEFQAMLEPFKIALFRGRKIKSPVEDGDDYFANAAIKARNGAAKWGVNCVGEDSGIEVIGLNHLPGHLTSRFSEFKTVDVETRTCAGHKKIKKSARDRLNNKLILDLLDGKTGDDRVAVFKACVVVASPDGEILFANEPSMYGRILDAPEGDGGFGFDPIMESFNYPGRSLAELTMDEKNLISPRGQALHQLLLWISNAYR